MKGLTTTLLKRACRIFVQAAYPEGSETIPSPKKEFLAFEDEQPLQSVLIAPVCQPLPRREGGQKGFALRLGSAGHPHLKLQIVEHGDGDCIFSVDTHDGFSLDGRHPDSTRWVELQSANRRLKERIERAWEEAGLLTFNGLLRRTLAGKD